MPDWTTIQKLLVTIPALPLVATAVTAVLGPKILRGKSHLPIIAALLIACVCSLALLREVNNASDNSAKSIGFETTVDLWTWAAIPAAGPTASRQPLDTNDRDGVASGEPLARGYSLPPDTDLQRPATSHQPRPSPSPSRSVPMV